MRVVINSGGRTYIGDVDQTVVPGVSVELKDARQLMVLRQPMQDPHTGQIISIQESARLMPIDLAKGPINIIHVIASSWYYPEEAGLVKEVEAQIEQAESDEKLTSASELLHIPGRG